jgi:aspartate racemase
MKTIGLVGGMSWESSAEYYRIINQEMKARLGGHRNAQSVMVTVNFEEIKALQHEARWDELGERMRAAALQVQAAGADFVVLCTNTMHRVAPVIEAALDIPFLHIVDPTAHALRDAHVARVGLLGTAFTMEQDFYRGRMEKKHGIEVFVPKPAQRALVHRIIYDELCHGIVRDASRDAYRRIIDEMSADGVDGVILGCTEIALLISQDDIPLPVFDTTALHAQAAVSMALL